MALGGVAPIPATVLSSEIRAVLLDCMGTLVALAPPGPALSERLRADHGLRIAPPDAERAFAAEIAYYRAHHHEGCDTDTLEDLRVRCAKVLMAALPAVVARTLTHAQLAAAMLAALRFSAYPDVPAALAQLRERGLTLVVVSNWDVSLSAVLRATDLAGLLDGAVSSAEVGSPKPQTAIFEAALARADVESGSAVHVGDSLAHDVAGARAAGIAPVLLRRGAAEHLGGPLGVPVISSLAELLT